MLASAIPPPPWLFEIDCWPGLFKNYDGVIYRISGFAKKEELVLLLLSLIFEECWYTSVLPVLWEGDLILWSLLVNTLNWLLYLETLAPPDAKLSNFPELWSAEDCYFERKLAKSGDGFKLLLPLDVIVVSEIICIIPVVAALL
jgi:hypothetical protein